MSLDIETMIGWPRMQSAIEAVKAAQTQVDADRAAAEDAQATLAAKNAALTSSTDALTRAQAELVAAMDALTREMCAAAQAQSAVELPTPGPSTEKPQATATTGVI